MRTINDKCNNCGKCIKVCPEHCITASDIHRIDINKCTDCLECVSVCSQNAIVEYIEPIEESPNYEGLLP